MHAKNGRMESAQRAQQYLDALENKYSHGDSTMKPDLECYQVCAAAWEMYGAVKKAGEASRRLAALNHNADKNRLHNAGWTAGNNLTGVYLLWCSKESPKKTFSSE